MEATLAIQVLSLIYLDAGEASKALEILDEGLEMRPGDPVLLLRKARALIDLGRYSEALPVVNSLPRDDPEAFMDPDMAYNLRIFGEWAYDLIGLAEFRLGRFSEARDASRLPRRFRPMRPNIVRRQQWPRRGRNTSAELSSVVLQPLFSAAWRTGAC